jgi:hypothetical protein
VTGPRQLTAEDQGPPLRGERLRTLARVVIGALQRDGAFGEFQTAA